MKLQTILDDINENGAANLAANGRKLYGHAKEKYPNGIINALMDLHKEKETSVSICMLTEGLHKHMYRKDSSIFPMLINTDPTTGLCMTMPEISESRKPIHEELVCIVRGTGTENTARLLITLDNILGK